MPLTNWLVSGFRIRKNNLEVKNCNYIIIIYYSKFWKIQDIGVKSQMENHCCTVQWKFIYSDWMAKSEVRYSKTSTQYFPSPPPSFQYCIYKFIRQIIQDRTLPTTVSATWIIAVFSTLRIISTISNHSLLYIMQCRKKNNSMCLVQVSQKYLKQSIQENFLLEAAIEEFKMNKLICKESIQWDRISLL